jgi:hypothetical protein
VDQKLRIKVPFESFHDQPFFSLASGFGSKEVVRGGLP